jgi:four helix bundle protein
MRRAAASVPTNIAEGCGRDSDPELRRFLRTAMGSASELEYQLLLSHDLAYFSAEDYKNLNDKITEVKRMLAGFIKKLNADC